MSEMRDAARRYAERGWHVLALHSYKPLGDRPACSCTKGPSCTSIGKHPINARWQASTRPDPDVIPATLTNPYTDSPNIGLATGSASGFWVLDIDPESGGFESMQAMMAGHDPLPLTYRVKTGSGGLHLYWALPDFEVTNSRVGIAAFGPGIDVRGTGGQVVAAPSVTDKGTYEVVTDIRPVRAPEWLEDLIRPTQAPEPASTQATRQPGAPVEPRLAHYTANAVKGLTGRLDAMREAATADGRGYRGEPWNQTCFEVACSLIELSNSDWNDLAPGDALLAFIEHAPTDAGFTKADLRTVWRSAGNKVDGKSRPEPPPPDEPLDLLAGVERRGQNHTESGTVPPPVEEPTSPNEEPALFGDDEPPHHSIFFDKKDLLLTTLARWVLQGEPLGWGADKSWWVYRHGVWVPESTAVQDRCVLLLGDTYRNGHYLNTAPRVRLFAKQLSDAPHQHLMNFTNGMLDWRTLKLGPHDPDLMSTVQFPLDWKPEATCPTFGRWLAEVLHPDYIKLAWEMLGYLMMSGNPQQVAFMLYGDGGNGKGTLIHVIESILGKHNCAAESLNRLNSDRFSPINLFGKIANIAGDIDGTYQESTAAFKSLTGQDTYGGERKYGDRFTFTSWAVPLFSANKIPGSADVTEGYLRRWVVLKFERKFVGADKVLDMADRLAAEREGIAVKAVEALRAMMARGRFRIEGEAAKGKEEFADTIDQVRQWMKSATIVAPDHFENIDSLYDSYRTWQDRNNVGKLGRLEFSHRLSTIGLRSGTEYDMQGFYGLRVSNLRTGPLYSLDYGKETDDAAPE